MRLRSAANNQATRRNEIIKSYLQLGSSSNRYAPRLPQQETKSSTKQLAPMDPILGPENLLKTGFAQKGLPSCPSGRHKPQSFMGPPGGPIFWDRMHSLVKEQKKSTFTVPFLGPSGGTKKEDRKIAQKGLPSCPSGRHKPQSFIETKRCASATLIQKTSKNEPKHGPKNGTAWRSHFLGPHAQLSKRTKEKHFHGPIFGTVWRYQKRDRKIAKSTAKADPCNKQKMTCV